MRKEVGVSTLQIRTTLPYAPKLSNNSCRSLNFSVLADTSIPYNSKTSSTRPFLRHVQCFRELRTLNASADTREQTTLSYNGTESEDTQFNWFQHWWPVQAIHNLKVDRPNKIQLLGRDFIVWKGHSGKWIAMDDQCPHRLAPLSEGRIEKDGNLLCSYHAWRFNECGKCVKIPHAETEKAHEVACNSQRSSVATYPCKAYAGLMWIWPDNSIESIMKAEATPIPVDRSLAEKLDKLYALGVHRSFIRYLPYNYDVLVENISDPSHVPVAHHGIVKSLSRYNAKPFHGKPAAGVGSIKPIAAMEGKGNSVTGKVQVELENPSTIKSYMLNDEGKEISRLLTIFVSPVCAGKCMILATTMTDKDVLNLLRPNPIYRAFSRMTKWITHVFFQNAVFDSDSVLLHEQDKKIRRKGKAFQASQNYYLPTNTDVLMREFRKWFETKGGYGAAYGGDDLSKIDNNLTKEQLLDRYNQHTKHCKVCTDALSNFRRAVFIFKTLSSFFLAAATFLYIKTHSAGVVSVLRNVSLMGSLVASALFALGAYVLEKKIYEWFYFKDHVHADKN